MKISKLPHTEDSIFARMGKVAAEFSAVNLSQGFPDFVFSSNPPSNVMSRPSNLPVAFPYRYLCGHKTIYRIGRR